MVAHPEAPYVAVALYAIFIYFGQNYYFAKNPAWNWRKTLACWNFGLSAFSLMGVIRLLPVLIHNFTHYTWKENYCMEGESHTGSSVSGLWLMLFVLSKFP